MTDGIKKVGTLFTVTKVLEGLGIRPHEDVINVIYSPETQERGRGRNFYANHTYDNLKKVAEESELRKLTHEYEQAKNENHHALSEEILQKIRDIVLSNFPVKKFS